MSKIKFMMPLLLSVLLVGCGDTPVVDPCDTDPTLPECCTGPDCGGEKPIGGKIKVSCPTEDRIVTNWIISEFQKTDEGRGADITVTEIKESDVRAELQADIDLAPDVFAIVDDNIRSLVDSRLLVRIAGADKTFVEQNNTEESVESVMVAGNLYGFPQTQDNGYVLFWNDAFLDAPDVTTIEGLLAKAASIGKKVYFDYNNGFYTPSIFFANGGTLSLDASGKQLTNFNNANGVQAAETFMSLAVQYATTMRPISENAEASNAMITGEACAIVSGTWNAPLIKEALGNNLKFSAFPTINIGGVNKPMGSFYGSKALSIKANTDNIRLAMAYAKFATSYAAQEYRFDQRQIGPSNIDLVDSAEVKADPLLSALTEQRNRSVSFPQALSVNDNFWTPMGVVGKCFDNGTWGSGQTAQSVLNAFVAQLTPAV